jgi:2-dehydropantoate 2-reductase
MSKKLVRFGFIGAGSIGSLFGGVLADVQSLDYSVEMVFFCRKAHAEEINKTGLKFENNQKVHKLNNISAYENPKIYTAALDSVPIGFDFLFLCTKTYDIEAAMVEYKELINESKWLVVLQNGIGNEDIIRGYCARDKILRIVTSNGALLKVPGHIVHTGVGFTKLGLFFKESLKLKDDELEKIQSDLDLLKNLLDLAGLKTTIEADIVKECWEKVFINIGINPFGALTRLKNGELLEIEGVKFLMAEAVNEAVEIAKKKEINLPEKDFVESMYDVARKTSENKNSMLQDVLKGKKTEIDFINGRIVKYAKELGIRVPINESLTYLIKGMERAGS